MFHKDDEIIDFLEETMEIHIPEEILKDDKKAIKEIEKNLDIKIPKKLKKKSKINKFLKKENDEYKDFLHKKRPKKLLKLIYIILILLIPTLHILIEISRHTNYIKIRNLENNLIVTGYSIVALVIIISSIYLINKIKKNKAIIGFKNAICLIIILIYTSLILMAEITIYHSNKFKNFLIRESMNTINHQYVANLFYNERTIENVLSKSIKVDNNLYEFEEINYDINKYGNKYEEEILNKENENDIYKIIKIDGTSRDGVSKYSGYMAVVYDPANVHLATSVGAGIDPKTSFGQKLSVISKHNNALVAINASGFYDPNWMSNGGIAHGPVIKDGKLFSEFARGIDSGGLVSITKDNKLLLKRMTGQEALDAGVRDAADWGPYLIVNGNNLVKDYESKWLAPRTAIGQRKDGIILLLVIDGRQEHSKGASYADVADIMEKYGAINAANMDGGTSTAMTVNHEYINKPSNGERKTYRGIPDAWIVTKEKSTLE